MAPGSRFCRVARWTKRTVRSGPPSMNARVDPSTLETWGATEDSLTSSMMPAWNSTDGSPGFDASVCHVTVISSSRVPNAMCTPVGACSFTAVAAVTATATSTSPNNRRMTLCEICCRCFPKPRQQSNDATLSSFRSRSAGRARANSAAASGYRRDVDPSAHEVRTPIDPRPRRTRYVRRGRPPTRLPPRPVQNHRARVPSLFR